MFMEEFLFSFLLIILIQFTFLKERRISFPFAVLNFMSSVILGVSDTNVKWNHFNVHFRAQTKEIFLISMLLLLLLSFMFPQNFKRKTSIVFPFF